MKRKHGAGEGGQEGAGDEGRPRHSRLDAETISYYEEIAGHFNLAQHPCANFAVQAAVAALRKPQQLKRMFEDLRPSFPQLLRSRRGGVLAALLAAAGRLGTQEAEAAAALWAAAGGGTAGTGSGTSGGAPLAALLTLDTHTQLGGSGGGRLSSLGCAMAAAVLRLPPAACRQWGEAVAALAPAQLQQVARDPGGCRVLEAYFEISKGAKKKKKTKKKERMEAAGDEQQEGGGGEKSADQREQQGGCGTAQKPADAAVAGPHKKKRRQKQKA
ncbi:hypothetical protein CHLNCDRAFT_141850 [Chlorella variabilis]|uniref:Uncharacterized protein n=1 Tax=Chlorella variabilis TaxID=554065 RepID=E1ZTQ1_CHLVA|nr:hypothetical protein CHLNCDRAFT_141850 [Chlorella variabilis]EFN50799.1 hypothetical protein CHLNCDRAFT_141850 [Chlorella variabilis]|eukprot:XP_005842901.1 hypothetical protein CHLNCDRAFT_141850 [Chlorella variabilis]